MNGFPQRDLSKAASCDQHYKLATGDTKGMATGDEAARMACAVESRTNETTAMALMLLRVGT